MKSIKLTRNTVVRVDDKPANVEVGDVVEVEDGEARRLVAMGKAEFFDKPVKLTAKDLIDQIAAAETLEDLEALRSEDEERTTVIAAYDQRLEELTAPPQ